MTILPERVLRKQSYDIVMLPTVPMVTRRTGIISRAKNELPIVAKRFIQYREPKQRQEINFLLTDLGFANQFS